MDSAITIAIMAACAAVLIAWDIYVAFFNEVPNRLDTESGILRSIGRSFVAVPLGWGILGGHFWGPSWRGLSPLWMLLIVPGLTLIHFLLRRFARLPAWSALVCFVFGIPIGTIFWPQ